MIIAPSSSTPSTIPKSFSTSRIAMNDGCRSKYTESPIAIGAMITAELLNTAAPDNHDPLDITIDKKKQQHRPSLQDRIKLIYIDDEYSGLTQGICGTVSGIYAANEICKSVNRSELIIWVKWDNGIDLGLIEGIDRYEIIVSDVTNSNNNSRTQAASQ
jgi:hypothetical protein